MDKALSTVDANRRFSELLRTEERPKGVSSALFARLRTDRVAKVGRWTRDELYDDGP